MLLSTACPASVALWYWIGRPSSSKKRQLSK